MANSRKLKGHNLEFRASDDDSWYSVRLLMKGQTMTVKYEGYTNEYDEVFDARDFKSKEEVDELVRRFRSVSPQMQDSECGSLKEGMVVCVGCNAFGGDDMLFYDAIIEVIHNVDHSFNNGEEECLCTFVVSWLHGPKKGYLTDTGIEGMCILKGVAQVGPRIASFLKLVNRNLGKSSCMLTSASKYEISASEGSSCENGGSNLSIISSFEGMNSDKSIVAVTTGATNTNSRLWEDDRDLGGQCPSSHLIFIENLERNLLPSSFRDFIHEHTSVPSQAYILPSPSMPYARGIIVVDSQDKHQKVLQFLDNPSHLIVSSAGRPLVVTERNFRHGMIKMWPGSYEPQDMCLVMNKDLMIIHSGTEAYERAKKLKDLFLEFTSHLRLLYKRFSAEEMMILQTQQQFKQVIDV